MTRKVVGITSVPYEDAYGLSLLNSLMAEGYEIFGTPEKYNHNDKHYVWLIKYEDSTE